MARSQEPKRDYDAVVIGAGFGGLYMMHKLRDQLGMNVRGFDRAGDVGGTWYWNRYPGARSDSDSFVYNYSFNEELLQDWRWTERYPRQPEVLSYLEHVADRFDLRRSFQFKTGITRAHFNEQTNLWELETDTGETLTTQYLVTALGLLSATNLPKFKGRESFKGAQYHTGNWPAGVDLTGKRVGLIGTGSTGVQVVTELGPIVKHLTVFQRTPQYSVPAQHGPLSDDYVRQIKANYPQIWKDTRESMVAFGFTESKVPAMSVSEEERRKVFQAAWDAGGGFRFMFGTFCDIAVDREANEAAASFIRGKIQEIVKDPETAKKLTPTELYARRPLCDGGYYETFNRDNVSLVDIQAEPITEITPEGVRTAGGDYPLDVLIFATGFDAVDGNYSRMDLRGRGGVSIKEKWQSGAKSYLGVTTSDFPNMFMILGPNGPFTNIPPSIEAQVEWIVDLIDHANRKGAVVVEATHEAEANWGDTCDTLAYATLFPHTASWIFGVNVPGKPRTVVFYMAGLGAYRRKLEEVKEDAYHGLAVQ